MITLFELFRFLVMPFGLCNVPASFQSYVDQALQGLERELVAYLDNILIYGSTLDELQTRTRYYLQCLKDNGLFAKLKKCKFEVNQTRILGFEVNEKSIFIKPEYMLTILNWLESKTIIQVQELVGFINFYYRFIYNISGIMKLIIDLRKLISLTFQTHFSGFIQRSLSSILFNTFSTISLCFSLSFVFTNTLFINAAISLVSIKFLRMLFIITWKITSKFVRSKNITVSPYTPRYIVKVAFHLSASFIYILLYSHLRSIFVNTFFVSIVLIKSKINGNGQLSLTVSLFRYQQSYTIISFCSFSPQRILVKSGATLRV